MSIVREVEQYRRYKFFLGDAAVLGGNVKNLAAALGSLNRVRPVGWEYPKTNEQQKFVERFVEICDFSTEAFNNAELGHSDLALHSLLDQITTKIRYAIISATGTADSLIRELRKVLVEVLRKLSRNA